MRVDTIYQWSHNIELLKSYLIKTDFTNNESDLFITENIKSKINSEFLD